MSDCVPLCRTEFDTVVELLGDGRRDNVGEAVDDDEDDDDKVLLRVAAGVLRGLPVPLDVRLG